MSMLKKFGSVTAVIAFINSPTGQRMLNKAMDVVNDPQNRAKATEFASKLRRPGKDASTPDRP